MISVCILGGNGSIGSALQEYLANDPELTISSPSISEYLSEAVHHDLVYYCIGMTSDFREFPYRTIEAHIEILARVLALGKFGRLVYLSSTRVYKNASSTTEDSRISVFPSDRDAIYEMSKLTGESLCILTHPDTTRIVRISNVIAKIPNPSTFLGFLASSINLEKLVLTSSLKSAKDFIYIGQLLPYLKKIGLNSKDSIYNIASGYNLQSGEIIRELSLRFNPGIEIFSDESRIDIFPEIDISKISSEFDGDFIDSSTMIEKIIASTKEFHDDY
jgi:nucleoside-diphosphate-sugar epimerase